MGRRESLQKKLISGAMNLWSIETKDPDGRRNFAIGCLLVLAYAIGCVPNLVERVVKLICDRPSTAWDSSIPLVGFLALMLFFWFSVKNIPPKQQK